MQIQELKSLQIGIACQSFKRSGGMERYVLDLVEAFSQLGLKPTVFSRNFDKNLPHYQWIKPVKVNVSWLPSKCRDYWFAKQLEKLKKHYKINLLLSTSRIGCADIAICGGTHIGYLNAIQRKKGFWDNVQVNLEKALYRNARLVVAHSEQMSHEIRDFYQIEKEKIHCLYPPVNLNHFSPLSNLDDKKNLRLKMNLPLNKFLFVYPVGGDFYRKGMPLLKDYFSQTELPIELLVVGKDFKETFPNMRYMGYCSDMKTLYQVADFSIMASLYEPFGLIGPESVACGTPLVLSDQVACKEVFTDRVCMTFKSNSLSDLSEKISSIIKESRHSPTQPLSTLEIKDSGLGLLDSPQTHLTKILNLI